jgi:hypothetical protein
MSLSPVGRSAEARIDNTSPKKSLPTSGCRFSVPTPILAPPPSESPQRQNLGAFFVLQQNIGGISPGGSVSD